jgi:hypothetical protein
MPTITWPGRWPVPPTIPGSTRSGPLDLAQKAVALNPADGSIWNTLGVAAYRLRDWDAAAEALQRSVGITPGAGTDCFFLAMTRWQQGKRDDAHQWFDHAIACVERTRSEDPEPRRFHAKAAALLGLPGPQPQPGPGGAPNAAARPPSCPVSGVHLTNHRFRESKVIRTASRAPDFRGTASTWGDTVRRAAGLPMSSHGPSPPHPGLLQADRQGLPWHAGRQGREGADHGGGTPLKRRM